VVSAAGVLRGFEKLWSETAELVAGQDCWLGDI
jgi:hypothetical protein